VVSTNYVMSRAVLGQYTLILESKDSTERERVTLRRDNCSKLGLGKG
jgi:hypothetical protein